MRVIVDQNELTQALQKAIRMINPQNTMAVLSGIELHAQADTLQVFSTDLTSALTLGVPARIEEPGRTVVSAHTFTDLIRRLPTATVELVEKHDGRLQVRYGKNRATLQTFGDELLPEFPDVDGVSLQLPAYTFQRLSKEVLFACSRDDTRGVLRGVGLTYGHGRLVFEGTDGSRFSHTWIAVPEFLAEPKTVVLPTKAILEAARLEDDRSARLTLGSKLARIDAERSVLAMRFLEGVYPDLSHAAPEQYVAVCRLSPSEFRTALERVQLITAKDNMSTIRLRQLTDQGIELSSSSLDVGSAVEMLECESHGEELDLLFNPQYLIDALKALSGDDVLFELSGAQSAARIRSSDSPNFFHAVLPMRQLV